MAEPTRASWRPTSPRSARSRSSRATSISSSPSSELCARAARRRGARGPRREGDAARAAARSGCSRTRTCSAASSAATTASSGQRDGDERALRREPGRASSSELYHFLDLEERADKPPVGEDLGARRGRSSTRREAFYAEVERAHRRARLDASSTRCSRASPTAALRRRRRALARVRRRAPRLPARARAPAR